MKLPLAFVLPSFTRFTSFTGFNPNVWAWSLGVHYDHEDCNHIASPVLWQDICLLVLLFLSLAKHDHGSVEPDHSQGSG